MHVRSARLEDSTRIAALMAQLGYDVPASRLGERLQRRNHRREVFVAIDDGNIIGWTAVSSDDPFVEGFQAHLEGLVVDESARSRGAGARLLRAAEAWARERGCDVMRVQSNVRRERAHSFYQRAGYVMIKAQYQFRKRL